MPLQILKILYCSLILSHLNYGILIWGANAPSIISLQKKTLRIVFNSKFNAHTETLFKKSHLLKLDHIYDIQLFKLLHKMHHRNIPVYFIDTYIT